MAATSYTAKSLVFILKIFMKGNLGYELFGGFPVWYLVKVFYDIFSGNTSRSNFCKIPSKLQCNLNVRVGHYVKFIYSEKATKFCEIFTLLLSYVVPV